MYTSNLVKQHRRVSLNRVASPAALPPSVLRRAQRRHPSHAVAGVPGRLQAPPFSRFVLRVSSETRESQTELFLKELEASASERGAADALTADAASLRQKLQAIADEERCLQQQIDDLYRAAFSGLEVRLDQDGEAVDLPEFTEQSFSELGKTSPEVMTALLKAKEKDGAGWQAFQKEVHSLKLRRSRLQQEKAREDAALTAVERELAKLARMEAEGGDEGQQRVQLAPGQKVVRVVLVTGFESFNVDLYRRAAQQLRKQAPFIQLQVFSDRDITAQREAVERALDTADVFFGSLLFDFDQVEWLRAKVARIPVRLVFESALELMSSTSLGGFQMANNAAPGAKAGPPPIVKKVLSLFGSGREEDKMVGYLSFLKIGPKLLKFIPGSKAKDLRNWLTVYGYWNQGGVSNVVAMFLYLVDQYFMPVQTEVREVVETPATGCLHPRYNGYFGTPAEYMQWYEKHGPLRGTGAPVVAVLLYRKHVITEQQYIPQLVEQMESEGVIPVPVFINGVEAHTIVRDQLTTPSEQAALKAGTLPAAGAPRRDAVTVDAVVSTIGFPLVGGPAGTMEGGRQAEVAKKILKAKNVPYVVAAPLLIQDMESWTRDGIAGLQSVVLYSLPELDGAIDTVPLGGLVGDNIFLVPERVKRLASRLRKWITLRRTPPADRKVAILLYGFPPGVGATGTAALLNVPKSLERLLLALHEQGYDLGEKFAEAAAAGRVDGEALITALKLQEDQRVVTMGAKGVDGVGAGAAEAFGVRAAAAEVAAGRLREMLTYPPEWGPSEWGPIPFLPENDVLVRRMEAQWGALRTYRGLMSTAKGELLVPGLQLGKVFVGVQPLLGIEGDPMRLLFERDLTPHPQYAAYYQWLQKDFGADAVLHFGMHGTVEWLPGAPLGNTGFSWSDVLLGDLPNVYIYACNNPSESIIAKRRGYGTIVSHNVPPYGRAGLYKQLAILKDLVAEYRENPSTADSLKAPIIEALVQTGLQEDCPFVPASTSSTGEAVVLKTEDAEGVNTEAFTEYCGRLYQYLQVVEGRLFSEGLHVLGQAPSDGQLEQYLSAYFGEGLPQEAVEAVAQDGSGGIEAVRARLERQWRRERVAELREKLEEAVLLRQLLYANSEEMDGVLRALAGEYIAPEAGGDLLRDGPGVLPTGRNIHALDPYRMPSPAALERGAAAARAILDDHRAKNGGAYPETVAVNLWGLDAIKTKGESVAMVLYLVGARPVREGTGRIARFELIPLEELGRPRVDVLCNMSGIFRDSFQNVVELLDDLFQRAASAEEPLEQNFVRRHTSDIAAKGHGNAAARIFSNPAGDYGSMVNERIGTGDWESGEELGETWASRNAYSYGRGSERGTPRPEVLQALLSSTERVVQQIDSVEYGLTDIQEYYANTGALKQAAESARGGRKVGCSIVEAWGKEVAPKELEEVLRLEYRSKLLNPRWAQAMADQGSGGAFEISQRMTAMVGWGATTKFQEDWTWDQAAETYALDPEMADKLRKANPQAYSNVLRRMLEAAGRGMWDASPETLEQLQAMYAEMDDELEGVAPRK